MTMPHERTRALRQAGELLRDLLQRQDIRNRLQGVLRHYPEEWLLQFMAEEWPRTGDSTFGLAPEPGSRSAWGAPAGSGYGERREPAPRP